MWVIVLVSVRAAVSGQFNKLKMEETGSTADPRGKQRRNFRAPQEPFTASDFSYGKLLGLGSYSKVFFYSYISIFFCAWRNTRFFLFPFDFIFLFLLN